MYIYLYLSIDICILLGGCGKHGEYRQIKRRIWPMDGARKYWSKTFNKYSSVWSMKYSLYNVTPILRRWTRWNAYILHIETMTFVNVLTEQCGAYFSLKADPLCGEKWMRLQHTKFRWLTLCCLCHLHCILYICLNNSTQIYCITGVKVAIWRPRSLD